jgi:branched-chain amino acid transport system ATP-binding protein
MVREVENIIRNIHESGVSVVLVEQNARLALRLSDTAYILETGAIALSGTAKDLAQDERVRKAYFGG